METLATIKGLGRVMQSRGNFSTNLRELKGKVISPRDEAYARIATNGEENIGQEDGGTRTSAGLEYTKGERPILRLRSRLLNPELARMAVKANSSGSYFNTSSRREYDQSLTLVQEGKALVLPSRDYFEMTPRKNADVLDFIFGDQAKAYWDFHLKYEGGIGFYLVDKEEVDSQEGTLLTQLWFHADDWCGRSVLDGEDIDLDNDRVARGVTLVKPSWRTKKSSKKVLPYTQADVKKYSK